jgi:RNA polymerase sigma-70 factor (ECF subfamily)
MQQRLARGEEAALGELYDRFASLIHNLANTIMNDGEAAENITREVFGYIWENPDAYDPKHGSMRSWVAQLTHRQAAHRLRQAQFDRDHSPEAIEAKVHEASAAARADYILSSMPLPLRQALELAYHRGRGYEAVAAELGVSDAEARRRLRLGLQLLSTAVDNPEGLP